MIKQVKVSKQCFPRDSKQVLSQYHACRGHWKWLDSTDCFAWGIPLNAPVYSCLIREALRSMFYLQWLGTHSCRFGFHRPKDVWHIQITDIGVIEWHLRWARPTNSSRNAVLSETAILHLLYPFPAQDTVEYLRLVYTFTNIPFSFQKTPLKP